MAHIPLHKSVKTHESPTLRELPIWNAANIYTNMYTIYILIDGQSLFHYLYEREPRDPQVFLNFFQSGIFIQKAFLLNYIHVLLIISSTVAFTKLCTSSLSVQVSCALNGSENLTWFFFSSKIFQINFISLCGGFSSLHNSQQGKRLELTATAHAPQLPIIFQWPGCSFQQNPARILRLLKNWKSNHSYQLIFDITYC